LGEDNSGVGQDVSFDGDKHGSWVTDKKRRRNMASNEKAVFTGFTDIDALMGGLRQGELTLLAARPSIGTTTLAMNIAFHAAAVEERRVLFFSLDSRGDIDQRFVSYVARVDASKMRRPSRLLGDEWARLALAAEALREVPLHIGCYSCHTVSILEDLCQEARCENPFELVVVDSLELVREGGEPRRETRVRRDERIEKMGRRLKALAKKLCVSMLVLAGVDRAIEVRADHRPTLADLPLGGRVADLAETVMFIYRDEVYVEDTPDPGIAEIIVAKEPRDQAGTVRLRFDGPRLRFGDDR